MVPIIDKEHCWLDIKINKLKQLHISENFLIPYTKKRIHG